MKRQKKHLLTAGIYGLLLFVFSSSMISYHQLKKARPNWNDDSEEVKEAYYAMADQLEACFYYPMQAIVLLLLTYTMIGFIMVMKENDFDDESPKERVQFNLGMGTGLFLSYYYIFGGDGLDLFADMYTGKIFLFVFFNTQIIANLIIYYTQEINEIIKKHIASYWLLSAGITTMTMVFLWNMEWVYNQMNRDELWMVFVFSGVIIFFLLHLLNLYLLEVNFGDKISDSMDEKVFMVYFFSLFLGIMLNTICGLDFKMSGYERLSPFNFGVVCCFLICCVIFYFNQEKPSTPKNKPFKSNPNILDDGFYEKKSNK